MSVEETYSLITILSMIGILQSSIENLLVAIKYPALNQFSLTKSIVKSKTLKGVSFAYESPGIWVLSLLKLLLASGTLYLAVQGEIYALLIAAILIIDMLTFPRLRYLPNSEIALQRAVLVGVFVHAAFEAQSISFIALCFISAQVSLAYFGAGYHKLKDQTWKNGQTLSYFFGLNNEYRAKKYSFLKILALGTLLFEMSFWMCLSGGLITLIYLALGTVFHGYLSLKKGYNFFLWSFLSCYPAVLYISNYLKQFLSADILS